MQKKQNTGLTLVLSDMRKAKDLKKPADGVPTSLEKSLVDGPMVRRLSQLHQRMRPYDGGLDNKGENMQSNEKERLPFDWILIFGAGMLTGAWIMWAILTPR